MFRHARRAYRFVQVDVFTDRRFGGNPLAVFFDGEGLSTTEMQAIAREMNLSETTFVLPPTRAACASRVRIFTPARELQFAGHPTIGTAYVLAALGLLPEGAREAVLEEAVGPVPVRLEGEAEAPHFVWMRHPAARFGPPLEGRTALAHALGLEAAALLEGAPIVVGSTGSAFLYVPLRDRAAVDRAVLDVPALLACFGVQEAVGVFVFGPEPAPTPGVGTAYARMFAPHTLGIPEDPATGSAGGPLGAYLVQHGLVSLANGRARIVSEQGTHMGRQSFLHIQVQGTAADQRIEVGGSVVPVLEGTLWLDE